MISAFAKAIAQLPEPAFRKVFLKSFLVTLVVMIVGGLLVVSGFEYLRETFASWLPGIVSDFLGSIAFVVGVWLFSPVIATVVITTFFMGEILAAVERVHYPHDAPGKDLPLVEEVLVGVRFIVVVIFLNLLALPTLLIGIGFFVYFALNGYLMGREYFEAVAHRYSDIKSAKALRRRERGRILMAGVLIAVLFTIPIVNFLAPVIAPVAMIHIFKGLRAA
ncbi:MAG: EI24 domain-containing protein [Proteobacteria bacterium]|nr:EI24 domain-containing protein [Pseudomonadota bacterium]MDA1057795.1 EI24 domain-containing protein [Pseudomonadota bacterium]